MKVNPKNSNKSVRRVGISKDEEVGVAQLTWSLDEKERDGNEKDDKKSRRRCKRE